MELYHAEFLPSRPVESVKIRAEAHARCLELKSITDKQEFMAYLRSMTNQILDFRTKEIPVINNRTLLELNAAPPSFESLHRIRNIRKQLSEQVEFPGQIDQCETKWFNRDIIDTKTYTKLNETTLQHTDPPVEDTRSLDDESDVSLQNAPSEKVDTANILREEIQKLREQQKELQQLLQMHSLANLAAIKPIVSTTAVPSAQEDPLSIPPQQAQTEPAAAAVPVARHQPAPSEQISSNTLPTPPHPQSQGISPPHHQIHIHNHVAMPSSPPYVPPEAPSRPQLSAHSDGAEHYYLAYHKQWQRREAPVRSSSFSGDKENRQDARLHFEGATEGNRRVYHRPIIEAAGSDSPYEHTLKSIDSVQRIVTKAGQEEGKTSCSKIDLSCLSLERLKELSGHY